MAATSLAEQLQKLAVPQTTIYKDDKKKASLLFDPRDAALKDRDTFYEIGISGLKELIAINQGFLIYEETLFSNSSKDFERAVESKEVNQNLDQTIQKFLIQLSPYLLLQSTHKALEWLINRYHIHQYNQDAIMALILPYHETNIFVRMVQLFDLKGKTHRWSWLLPIQKTGTPLAKSILFNQCVSNPATLKLISRNTQKCVEEFGIRATELNTVFAFFCSTLIGTINTSKKVTEPIMNAILATLVEGLDSPIDDFRSSAYVILGYISTKTSLKLETLNAVVDRMLNFDINYDSVLLLNLIYSNQSDVKRLLDPILYNISGPIVATICKHLKKLVENKINVHLFVKAFLNSILAELQKDAEKFTMYTDMLVTLIDEVDLTQQNPEKIIKRDIITTFPAVPAFLNVLTMLCMMLTTCLVTVDLERILSAHSIVNTCERAKRSLWNAGVIIHSYKPRKQANVIKVDDEVTMVDESSFTFKKLNWFSLFLKSIETKYPEIFDKVVKEELNSNNQKCANRQMSLTKILGFNPAIAHKVGGAYLFENLNHVNPVLRIKAVKYIKKEFKSLKNDNEEFVKESILNRLRDDDPKVVTATLQISTADLNELFNEAELTDAFLTIVARGSRKWNPVVNEAIDKLCALDVLPVNQTTVLTLTPYLFPHDKESALMAWKILNSSWGQKFDLTKSLKLNNSFKDNSNAITQMIYNELFVKKSANFDFLDPLQLNKSNILDISMFLLLKSCSFEQTPISELADILSLLLESVEGREIIPVTNRESFSMVIIPEFIKMSHINRIVFEVMEYIFTRIIEGMNIKNLSKPWCNLLKNEDSVLVRRLFEILVTGCSIESYGQNYSTLLQKLLDKFFNNPREKFEFIANFACGHILYATDPDDVINPELQIKSLKLLYSFITMQQNAWMYDSDVLMLMIIFNLNNPITLIRSFTLEMIDQLLKGNSNKNLIYVQLMSELWDHKEELLLDHEQISQVLDTVLTQSSQGNKLFRKNCLAKFIGIVTQDTPGHISCELLKIMSPINNIHAFTLIVPCINKFERILKENENNPKFIFDVYESKIFRNICSRIDASTISSLSKGNVWSMIAFALKEYRECVMEDDQTVRSPSVLVMKQINEEVFKKVPEERTKDLVYLIAVAGAFSNNPLISSVASKTMRKIHLNFADFRLILEKMLNASDPATVGQKKKSSSVSMLSYQLTETDEWRLGVTLLEFVQNKKKMTVDNSFVSILFQVLKKCLRFEEQSYVEYPKQLVLSSLWYYCKKFVDDKDKDQLRSLKSMFDIELVVQCIRGTQNPQTHHHALILMSHAAYMLPEQVLHHTMEIFTFMGSSVLRHDDAYSFQIIIKIIETLIPILVQMDKSVEEYTDREIQQLQKRVVPVLRIFADVVLHVPEHRRLPLFKKLLETLGPSQFLWTFLALLLEAHVTHSNDGKEKKNKPQRTLAEKESPMNRLDFGHNILLEFSPEICMENFVKLMLYVKTLPMQKDENSMKTDVDPSEIFSVSGHRPIQLRHYKYVIITFMNTFLASSQFIHHTRQATEIKTMENYYKTYIINILTFIQSISKITDEKTVKYYRVMLHHSYDLLDHTNNLLSAPMFLSVVRGLLKHTLQTVRRKSMELLNSKIQYSPEMFKDVDKTLLHSLLPVLLDIVKTIDGDNEDSNKTLSQDLEMNQQTALLSLKLLARMLASDEPAVFGPVLETVTEYTCHPNLSGNVMASVVLTLAELCGNMKAYALTSLHKFMPALIKVLKMQRKAETPELVLLSTVTALSKIIESLPLFLSPYLQKILYEYAMLVAKWQSLDQECTKVTAIITKLTTVKKKIASSIPPRVLIPIANATYQLLLDKEQYEAIGPVMSVLAESFASVTAGDFTALQQDLTAFFLTALQLRSDSVDKADPANIDAAEDEVVNALVSLVLKLSETSFRPFFFKIYDWAIRTNVDGQRDRAITFYRVSSAIADKLKGLFVLFAGHFIKNAADLLDSCNKSKTEDLFFDSEDKCITLVSYIIKTLHIVFLYDSQNFLNRDRFETLMQPVVDQLENQLCGISSLKERVTGSLIPCIAQFAVATADDSLWKLLNYQVLLKTRHNDAEIRLMALECLVAMATQLGSSWLPLLAESVPFLAELLEDGDSKIEATTKEAIRKLETILGEPLEKYF